MIHLGHPDLVLKQDNKWTKYWVVNELSPQVVIAAFDPADGDINLTIACTDEAMSDALCDMVEDKMTVQSVTEKWNEIMKEEEYPPLRVGDTGDDISEWEQGQLYEYANSPTPGSEEWHEQQDDPTAFEGPEEDWYPED